MSDNSSETSRSARAGVFVRLAIKRVVGGFLWLVVLVPILGVSAYSLYFIGRYLGAPPYIAIAFSTCFDGVALFAARKSVDYAQAGLSGSFPAPVVRLFAFNRQTSFTPSTLALWPTSFPEPGCCGRAFRLARCSSMRCTYVGKGGRPWLALGLSIQLRFRPSA